MKKKISLLVAGTALSFMACSSLEVSNPTEENFPAGWNVEKYMELNPDLKALMIADKIAIMNKESGIANDDDAFVANTDLMAAIATQFAGFTATTWDATVKEKLEYIKKFNIYGSADELTVIPTLKLDMDALAEQYVAYGKRDGRPYRDCAEGETSVVKGSCQAGYSNAYGYDYYDNHLYCAKGGVTYCIDCTASDVCPVVAAPTQTATDSTATPAANGSADSATPAAGE